LPPRESIKLFEQARWPVLGDYLPWRSAKDIEGATASGKNN
jgi:hypothetical protein